MSSCSIIKELLINQIFKKMYSFYGYSRISFLVLERQSSLKEIDIMYTCFLIVSGFFKVARNDQFQVEKRHL